MRINKSTADYMRWSGALLEVPEAKTELIQDWHEHEFSDITDDEIRVIAINGKRVIEYRLRGAK